MKIGSLAPFLLGWAFVACGGPSQQTQAPPLTAPVAQKGTAGPAGVRHGVIELRRWRDPAERVVIDASGLWVGPEGEPLIHYLFSSRGRMQELSSFVRTYAPFRGGTDRGELAFGGKGSVTPEAAEKRMIAEWARMVVAEVIAGRSSAAYGLAFAWHRGGSVGNCEDLAVYLSGDVRAGSCSWESEVRGRLAPEQIARLYDWFDALAPFQQGEEGGGASGEPSRLVFGGVGRKEARPEQIAEIRAFAMGLYREQAAREPGGQLGSQSTSQSSSQPPLHPIPVPPPRVPSTHPPRAEEGSPSQPSSEQPPPEPSPPAPLPSPTPPPPGEG